MADQGQGGSFSKALGEVLVALAKAEATPDADHGVIGQIRQSVLSAINPQSQAQTPTTPTPGGPTPPPGLGGPQAPPQPPPGAGLPGVAPNSRTLTPDVMAALTQGMAPEGQQLGAEVSPQMMGAQ